VDDLVLLRLVLLFRGESSPRVFRAVASRALPRARAFLKSTPTGRPWFLWLHFYDVHLPHSIEEPEGPLSVETVLGSLPDPCLYRDHPAPAIGPVGMPVGTKGGPDEKLVRSRRCDAGEKLARRLLTYRAEVQHVDAALGELLGELEERGELDSTAIVVTADHGESLTEHGFRLAHQFSAYEPVLRVPLVVVPPGSTEGSEVSELAQHRDLAATASELLGLEDRTGGRSWLGASAPARVGSVVHAPFLPMLRPRGKGEADALPRPGAGQIIRVAVRDDSLGLVRTAGLPDELYDLRDDPSQVTDLVSTEGSPVPEGLGEVATAIQERLGRRSPEELEPEDQDLEALRALGYVE